MDLAVEVVDASRGKRSNCLRVGTLHGKVERRHSQAGGGASGRTSAGGGRRVKSRNIRERYRVADVDVCVHRGEHIESALTDIDGCSSCRNNSYYQSEKLKQVMLHICCSGKEDR